MIAREWTWFLAPEEAEALADGVETVIASAVLADALVSVLARRGDLASRAALLALARRLGLDAHALLRAANAERGARPADGREIRDARAWRRGWWAGRRGLPAAEAEARYMAGYAAGAALGEGSAA